MWILIKLLLSPLLLLQALWVRKVTPKLPEAAGAREGHIGTGRPLRLLFSGDSAMAGVGVAQQSEALSGAVLERLSPDYEIDWTLIAKTGWTTQNLLTKLHNTPAKPVDIAILSLGVNDVLSQHSPARFRREQEELRTLLKEKFGARLILSSAVPEMGKFPALPQPLRWTLGRDATRLNTALADSTATDPAAHHLTPEIDLTPDLMASDGFHPGAKGYQLWADAVTVQIRQEFPR
ncbi:MAG: lipase [Rhodobacterales bacterium]|nr:MAG: lipase [Rhodobacterales bacterium]